jgi:hypothetical protein
MSVVHLRCSLFSDVWISSVTISIISDSIRSKDLTLEVLEGHYYYGYVVKCPSQQSVLNYILNTKACLLVNAGRLDILDRVPYTLHALLI